MKKIKAEDAVGQTLCHDMTAILADGFKGVRFPRGHVIRKEDIDELHSIGKRHIFVWEPGVNEVHEDDASRELADVIYGQNVAAKGPKEGKMDLIADADGLFCVNEKALLQINKLPDYTVACRENYLIVKKGYKLAGLRIVPLVTARENVDRAVEIASAAAPVFEVRPLKPLKAGLVITGSEIYNGIIEDKMEPIMRAKVDDLGGQFLRAIICDDDRDMIVDAVSQLKSEGAELILLTGGMSVDPDDVTPSAIRSTGARIVTQGVPIQPGNMLTIAYDSDGVTLIGVPGASMHSPFTSLDMFLPRVFAGVEITEDEIAGYGVGGLL